MNETYFFNKEEENYLSFRSCVKYAIIIFSILESSIIIYKHYIISFIYYTLRVHIQELNVIISINLFIIVFYNKIQTIKNYINVHP